MAEKKVKIQIIGKSAVKINNEMRHEGDIVEVNECCANYLINNVPYPNATKDLKPTKKKEAKETKDKEVTPDKSSTKSVEKKTK